jgi:hypothetical protein
MRRKLAVLTLVLCLTTWGFAPVVGATAAQQDGQAPALTGQSAQVSGQDVSTQANPPSQYTTIADAGDVNASQPFVNLTFDLSNQTGAANDTLYVRFEDADETDGSGGQLKNLSLRSDQGTIADFQSNTTAEREAGYRGIGDNYNSAGNHFSDGTGFFVYAFDISGTSTLTLSVQVQNEYQISVATERPTPFANTTVGTVNDSTLPDNTTVTRTVSFNATNVSADGSPGFDNRDAYRTIFPDFLNVTDASVDVTAPDGSDVPTRANEPVIINNGSAIRYTTNYQGANPAELAVNVTFTAETNDTGATNTGPIQNRILDSDNGDGGQSAEVTLQNTTQNMTPTSGTEASLTVDTSGIALTEADSAQVPLVINSTTENGLSGYDLNVTLSNASVLNVTGVEYNEAAFNLTSQPTIVESNGSIDVELVATDLANNTVAGQTNLTLALLNVTGQSAGTTTFDVDVDQVDDDTGGVVQTTSVPSNLTVEEEVAGDINVLPDGTLTNATVQENTTTSHTLTFDVENVSADGGTDEVTVTLPATSSFVDSSISANVTDGTGAGVQITNQPNSNIDGVNNGTNNRVEITVSPDGLNQIDTTFEVSFEATHGDVEADTTAGVVVRANDSSGGDSDEETVANVTIENVRPPSNVDLSNVSLTPDTVDEDTTETHTLNFTVSELSADGQTDTITATLPAVATVSSVSSVTLNGQDVTGSATVTNDNRSLVVESNETGGSAVTADVSATFDATFDNVTGDTGVDNVTADATVNVTDSANGTIEAGVPVTVVNTLTSSVTFDDQTVENNTTTVTVASATLSDGGFVVIHANNNGSPGEVLGVSSYLEPGTATDVSITLDAPLTANRTLFAMAHADDGNQTYEFAGPGTTDLPYPDEGFLDSANITVENETNPFPNGLPGGSSDSGVPTDPDDDGLFEDLDGDGDFDFVDVIEFVFAIDSLDNLPQEQIEALDFDGSGSVDFVDVIDLVFQINET